MYKEYTPEERRAWAKKNFTKSHRKAWAKKNFTKKQRDAWLAKKVLENQKAQFKNEHHKEERIAWAENNFSKEERIAWAKERFTDEDRYKYVYDMRMLNNLYAKSDHLKSNYKTLHLTLKQVKYDNSICGRHIGLYGNYKWLCWVSDSEYAWLLDKGINKYGYISSTWWG